MAYKGKYNLSGNELLSRSVRVTGELNPTKREDVKAKMSNTKQNNIVKKCPYCSVESKNYSNLTRYHFDNCKSKP